MGKYSFKTFKTIQQSKTNGVHISWDTLYAFYMSSTAGDHVCSERFVSWDVQVFGKK